MTAVLVLAGGPDAEREVSRMSARTIVEALSASGHEAHLQEIGRIGIDALRRLPGEVVFPALHGRWGEGGPLQDLLEMLGRPYVGSGPRAARLAMDKLASKSLASRVGLDCTTTCIFDPDDDRCPLELPVVVKPIFEGSTVGLHVCRTALDWQRAHRMTCHAGKPAMIEPYLEGRELTLGLVAAAVHGAPLETLPLIEIIPADGLYDYQAKYHRDDTSYRVDPELAATLVAELCSKTLSLAAEIGIRDLCRADFILGDDGSCRFLEVNTMPGFTSHSLVPRAATSTGIDLPALCERLIDSALSRSAAIRST